MRFATIGMVCLGMTVALLAMRLDAGQAVRGVDDGPEWATTPMRTRQMPAVTYMFRRYRTTLGEIAANVADASGDLMPMIESGRVRTAGPFLMQFIGAQGDPTQEFELQVGWVVAEGHEPIEGFELESLPAFKCATIVYTGRVVDVSNAYTQLFMDASAEGLVPTGVTREYSLYWEGPDSANNVALIAAGVKE